MSWARERTYLVEEEDCPRVIFAVCAAIPAMICSVLPHRAKSRSFATARTLSFWRPSRELESFGRIQVAAFPEIIGRKGAAGKLLHVAKRATQHSSVR
jgi:hypothetical protein